ncbi:unnamed protein product [Callosobruchus maculatus]|uniref:Uncharacterized protein n=1 Tax=Callosobruchus maculatus TaxID=64391 RepID=A0A653CYU5_CALMS|nr:unnamed protein product [Callosobruchus maculatus]
MFCGTPRPTSGSSSCSWCSSAFFSPHTTHTHYHHCSAVQLTRRPISR